MNRRVTMGLVVLGAWMMLASSAYAQSVGVRAGLGADPNQFLFGIHVESPGLTQSGHLTFRPNVDLGTGNGDTRVSGNLEFVYWVQYPNSNWSSYFGAGPAVMYDHNDFDSGFHGGYNGVVGFQHTSGLFIEVKAGGGGGASGLKTFVGYVIAAKKN